MGAARSSRCFLPECAGGDPARSVGRVLAGTGHDVALIHTVVAGALRSGSQVLLCHRTPQRRWYPNVWDFPGGHVEEGEHPADALRRELLEELGVTVLVVPVEAGLEIHEEDLDLTVWTINEWSGTPTNLAPTEHDGLAWFELSDAVALPLAHPSYPRFLARMQG